MMQMMGIVLIIIIILNLGPYWHTREHCLGLQWKEIIATTQRDITHYQNVKYAKNSISTFQVHLGTSRTFDERLFSMIWQEEKKEAVHCTG